MVSFIFSLIAKAIFILLGIGIVLTFVLAWIEILSGKTILPWWMWFGGRDEN